MEFDDLQNLPGAGTNAEEGSVGRARRILRAPASRRIRRRARRRPARDDRADLAGPARRRALRRRRRARSPRRSWTRDCAASGRRHSAALADRCARPPPGREPTTRTCRRSTSPRRAWTRTPPARSPRTCSSARWRSRTSSRTTGCSSPSPTRPTCRPSTSSASPRATRSRSASRPAEDIEVELKRLVRATEAWERAALVEDELDEDALGEDEDDLEADDGVSDAPLVRLVNSIILQAAEDGASDLHFDPQDDALVVRLRVDGVLHEVQRIPKRLAPGVTTRLKVLAKLDIAERRKPQDGRISLNAKAAGRMLDIRVAVLPTVEGEGVVMRLLDKSKRPPTLAELGLSDEMRAMFEEIIEKPTGALLVTGPTGSGKSTTLYASLAEISRPEINVITVEDPVEYRLAGLNQVQVNNKAGLTFANALRSILRSDPDVVMVGEIRDAETAKISIEAALTGHFVLSTLHTNDAPSALTRLNEMGVEPFLTGSAVTAVLAQRLVAQALHALLRDVHGRPRRRCSRRASRPSRPPPPTASASTARRAARAATRPATRAASASTSS